MPTFNTTNAVLACVNISLRDMLHNGIHLGFTHAQSNDLRSLVSRVRGIERLAHKGAFEVSQNIVRFVIHLLLVRIHTEGWYP